MGPEGRLIDGGKCKYEIRSDIYSLGVMLFQVLHKDYEIPFNNKKLNLKDIIKYQKQKGQTFIKKKLNEVIASENTKNVILKCLKVEVDQRYPCIDDFLADLTGATYVPKPATDIKDYREFIQAYKTLMSILKSKKLHQGSAYSTASLEDIDRIQNGLYELLRLDSEIRNKDLSGYEGDILSEIEPKIEEARDRRYQEASRDQCKLDEMINKLASSKTSISWEDLNKKIIDMYKITFCWGPPLATSDGERRLGRERYSLNEIKKGVYLEAIDTETQDRLGLK
jgi:serine/threonine protein kinase